MKASDVKLRVAADDAALAELWDEWVVELPPMERRMAQNDLRTLVSVHGGGRAYFTKVRGVGINAWKATLMRVYLFTPLAVKKARVIVKSKPVVCDGIDVAKLQGVK